MGEVRRPCPAERAIRREMRPRKGPDVAQDDELDQVIGSEMRLLDPRVRASAEAVTALLHDEFREFGASGRVWDLASIVPAVTADPGTDPKVGEMTAVRLAPDVILLTYCVTRPGGRTLRSSVWLRDPAGWRLYFHQGTLQL
jgi:hypothetical protein